MRQDIQDKTGFIFIFNDMALKPIYLFGCTKNQKFNLILKILFILSKKIKLIGQVDVLQRFLHSAPHFVRRSSRNDSKLPCHPARSASGVEGSFEIPPLAPTSSWLGRNDRGRFFFQSPIILIQPIMPKNLTG